MRRTNIWSGFFGSLAFCLFLAGGWIGSPSPALAIHTAGCDNCTGCSNTCAPCQTCTCKLPAGSGGGNGDGCVSDCGCNGDAPNCFCVK